MNLKVKPPNLLLVKNTLRCPTTSLFEVLGSINASEFFFVYESGKLLRIGLSNIYFICGAIAVRRYTDLGHIVKELSLRFHTAKLLLLFSI